MSEPIDPASEMGEMLRMVTLEQIPAGDYSALERFWAVMESLPFVPRLVLADDARRCRAMDYRAHDERHACALCAPRYVRAEAAVIAGPSDLIGAARWLDVCWACYGQIRAIGGYGLNDAELLVMFEDWKSRCAITHGGQG